MFRGTRKRLKYLVFARSVSRIAAGEHNLAVNFWRQTRPLKYANEALSALGPGLPPEQRVEQLPVVLRLLIILGAVLIAVGLSIGAALLITGKYAAVRIHSVQRRLTKVGVTVTTEDYLSALGTRA